MKGSIERENREREVKEQGGYMREENIALCLKS